MKKIAFIVALILCLSMPAFAATNTLNYSSSGDSATFFMTADELDKNYNDSSVKYYTFSVAGLTVRADKNCFYDFDLKSVQYKLTKNSFVAVFTYNDNSERIPDSARLDLKYTVTGEKITERSVASFSGDIVTSDSAKNGEIVFFTKKFGAFDVTEYKFSDVSDPKAWYYKYVNGCAALGVLSGMGDGTFAPQKTVTRAELAVMIVRATDHLISYRIDDSVAFTDVKKGKWYYDYVMKCASVGIIFGKGDGKFAPDDNATREEIAALASRVIKIAGSFNGQPLPAVDNADEVKTLYPDGASVSKYAKADVVLCNRLSVMVGDKTGFRPKANTTRAECAKIFYDIKKSLK